MWTDIQTAALWKSFLQLNRIQHMLSLLRPPCSHFRNFSPAVKLRKKKKKNPEGRYTFSSVKVLEFP